TQHFPHIMKQPGEHHPVGMTISAYSLRRLQQMLELVKVGVRIRIVNQLVEEFKRIPYGHFLFVERQVLRLLLKDKLVRLIRVIETIEFTHRIPRRSEERRVGKECRWRWRRQHAKKR